MCQALALRPDAGPPTHTSDRVVDRLLIVRCCAFGSDQRRTDDCPTRAGQFPFEALTCCGDVHAGALTAHATVKARLLGGWEPPDRHAGERDYVIWRNLNGG